MKARVNGLVLVLTLGIAPGAFAQAPMIRIDGPLAGGVPTGTATTEPLALTLPDAVRRGLDHNLAALVDEQRVRQAEGQRWRALSGVLPNLSGNLQAAREKINLAAFGFTAPGIPQLVGPFSLYDTRLRLSQSLVDLSAISEARAGAQTLEAQKAGYADTRSLVVAAITNLYLVAVADKSRVDAAQAEEKTAETVHRLAVDQNEAGVVPKLDALRSDVELRTALQRLIVVKNDLDKDMLALARAIGLPLGQVFTLADEVPFVAAPPVDLAVAAKLAYAGRDDYKAAQARVAAAEAERTAARQAHLPSLTFDGDYGAIGNTTQSMLATFTAAANVHVPLFDAGKTKARSIEADADLKTRLAEAEDLRARIYYEVQGATLDLAAAADQVSVAREAVNVAEQALAQAEDRFRAGVTNNLEVVEAQQALSNTRENFIGSLYSHNVAKAALARALGLGEQEFLQILEGKTSWPTNH
jgi:outer membrane protein TolC